MSRVVLKHKLNMGLTQIELPVESKVVLAGVQDGVIYIWVEQPTGDVAKHIETFYVIGTGRDITGHKNMDHVGSVLQGPFIWHIYRGWG